jgi:hypothetical protein
MGLGADLEILVFSAYFEPMAAKSDEICEETEFWLSQPGIHESFWDASKDLVEGSWLDERQVRLRFGLAPDTERQNS